MERRRVLKNIASSVLLSGTSDKIFAASTTPSTSATVKTASVTDFMNSVEVRDAATNNPRLDHTASIQRAIDSGCDELIFPPGKYQASSLKIRPMILSGYGATLAQLGGIDKFTRLLDTNDRRTQGSAPYSGSTDSPLLTIQGFVLDGNRKLQGAYEKFELEHAALVFLTAAPDSQGRLRVQIKDLTCIECVADAINVSINVDAVINNCKYWNCFRGSVTCTGGNSIVRMAGQNGDGDVHFSAPHIEIDGLGFNNSYQFDFVAQNCHYGGGLAVAIKSGKCTYLDCTFDGKDNIFNINCEGIGSVAANNCNFTVRGIKSRILRPGKSSFSNCRFKFSSLYDSRNFIQMGGYKNQTLSFLSGCRFTADESYNQAPPIKIVDIGVSRGLINITTEIDHGFAADDFVSLAGLYPVSVNGTYRIQNILTTRTFTVLLPLLPSNFSWKETSATKRGYTWGVGITAGSAEDNNTVIVDSGVHFDQSLNYALYLAQGGKAVIRSAEIDSATFLFLSTASRYPFQVLVGTPTFGPNIRAYAVINASVSNGSSIEHDHTVIPELVNVISTKTNLSQLNVIGHRTIQASTAPASTSTPAASLTGDQWTVDSKRQTWKAMKSSPSGSSFSWQLEQ